MATFGPNAPVNHFYLALKISIYVHGPQNIFEISMALRDLRSIKNN